MQKTKSGKKSKSSSSKTKTTKKKTSSKSGEIEIQGVQTLMPNSQNSKQITQGNQEMISNIIKQSQKENSIGTKEKPLSKRFSNVILKQSKNNGNVTLFGWSEKYHLESDPAMYTKPMLSKRKALRNDTTLKSKIESFINEVYKIDNGNISRDEYYRVHKLITTTLHSNINAEEMNRLAEEDWKKDSDVNSDSLSKEKLQDGIFELVDLWTTKADLQEYVLFLDTLKVRMKHPGGYDNTAYSVLF